MNGKFHNINRVPVNSRAFKKILDSINSKEDCEEARKELGESDFDKDADWGAKVAQVLEKCKEHM